MPRPEPQRGGLDAPFWTALGESRLVAQQCSGCHAFRFPPEWVCSVCQSFAFSWVDVRPRGRVFSWTRVWYAAHPALVDSLPYLAVVVELDEHPLRFVGNLLGDPEQEVEVGLEVEAVFEHDGGGGTLLQWQRPQ